MRAMRRPTTATRSTDPRPRRSRRRAPRRALVGRQSGPPGADGLEGVPKGGLRGLLVEGGVDVGAHERLDRRREMLELANLSLERTRQRAPELVREPQRVLAHDDEQLRLDDPELPREPRARLRLVRPGELHA